MTAQEFIGYLQELPPEYPVYLQDIDGDWLPLKNSDIQLREFIRIGRHFGRHTDFFIAANRNDDPLNTIANGIGISI